MGGGQGGGHPAQGVGQAGEGQQSQGSELLLEKATDNADEGSEDVVETDCNEKLIESK